MKQLYPVTCGQPYSFNYILPLISTYKIGQTHKSLVSCHHWMCPFVSAPPEIGYSRLPACRIGQYTPYTINTVHGYTHTVRHVVTALFAIHCFLSIGINVDGRCVGLLKRYCDCRYCPRSDYIDSTTAAELTTENTIGAFNSGRSMSTTGDGCMVLTRAGSQYPTHPR